ncbi:MAG: hypothetical protein II953_07160, partial [Clostridia bacterium]|nr:hypothetical protein [Clostridia bacterium]
MRNVPPNGYARQAQRQNYAQTPYPQSSPSRGNVYGNPRTPPPYVHPNPGRGTAYAPPRNPANPRVSDARARMERDVKARKKAEKRASRRRGLRTLGRFAVYVLCAVVLLSLI